MKIFISADIEGVSGVVNKTHTTPQGHDYNRARTLMTNEVNAVIQGAIDAGAKEIIINDSHGPMTNILLEALNPKAKLITGTPKPFGMMQGVDGSYDAVMLIGYHSRMNTKGILSHSYHSGVISNININGKDVGEFHINSAVAGYFGVPVVMVSGDDMLSKEVKDVDSKIEAVIVKEAQTRFCAMCLTPAAVHEMLREKAKNVLSNDIAVKPITLGESIEMEVSFINSGMADVAAIMPGTELIEPNKVLYKAANIIEAYRALMTMYMLANSVL